MSNRSGAVTRQQYERSSTKTTISVRSSGDKSGKYNSTEEAYQNGTHNIESDRVSKTSTRGDRVASYGGNHISDVIGNESNHTNGLNEGAFGSRTRIIGNPDVVNGKLHEEAERLKTELVAARSGFNDDRNDTSFNPIKELFSIPGKILDAVTSIDDDVAEGDDEPLFSGGTNLFTSMMADVANEIAQYTKKLSKISLSGSLEKARLVTVNEVEKQKKQLELIEKLPDSASKEKLKEAVAKGDLAALLSNPSNENKEKNSKYKADEYEQKAAEIIPQLIELERQSC
jgi:hypothetical protein